MFATEDENLLFKPLFKIALRISDKSSRKCGMFVAQGSGQTRKVGINRSAQKGD